MTTAAAATDAEARIDSRVERGVTRLRLEGPWVTRAAAPLDRELSELVQSSVKGEVVLDLSGVTRLDTVGAWLVHRTQEDLAAAGATVRVEGVSDDQKGLLEAVSRVERDEPIKRPHRNILYELALRTGKATYHFRDEAVALLSFLGMLVVKSIATLLHPSRIRITALAHNIEATGLNAMPIVGLLSFLIGVVLAYQGADQLSRFGAQIFVVNLLGVSVLRELGGLITAIIVAGRSGSAFTAQIGTMQVNQEVDAMETLGLDPIEVLVIPRVFALAITLPLLTFYASMMAIFGGALMSYFVLDISGPQFLQQFKAAISVSTFWVGMVKAPVFAFAIAMVGCYEGLKVSGSAESVGRLTTQSVVVSIFLVIVLDALFSILFATLGSLIMHKDPQAPPPEAPDDDAVIRVRGLKTQFGAQVIHDGLDLDVRRGEVLGVVGGSGTGKSVLLKEIIGLIRPAAGSIEVLGIDMDQADEAERRAVQRRWGVMFQDGALFSSMTVAENIQVPMKEYTHLSHHMMDELARVKIAMAGLACSAGIKHPSELSGGMRKRAALARALALDPEIIFLDEPTAGLDPIGAAAFDQLISELQRSLRLTVFMVTHDLDSLVTICDRIAVLIDKKVVVDTYENLLKVDHPWIQEYFHGPRGRAAAAEHAAVERAQMGAEG